MTGGRTRTQQLIDLAEQVATAPDPEPSRTGVRLLAAITGVVLLGALAIGIVVATGGDGEPDGAAADSDSDVIADDTLTAASLAPASDASPATAAASTAAANSTSSDTAAPTSTTAAPATSAPAAAPTSAAAGSFTEPVRWAEFSGGIVTLSGIVPDQATADEVRAKAAAVVGEANVVVQYEIVPGAPRPDSAPLYVRDSVLFDKNSVEIGAAARGVLDLGAALMSQNPQVTIDIQGHTDADGSDATNLALSQRRVEVIEAYLVAQGIDPRRLTTAAFGETQPIADNATADGRAENRRVEFTINDLLG